MEHVTWNEYRSLEQMLLNPLTCVVGDPRSGKSALACVLMRATARAGRRVHYAGKPERGVFAPERRCLKALSPELKPCFHPVSRRAASLPEIFDRETAAIEQIAGMAGRGDLVVLNEMASADCGKYERFLESIHALIHRTGARIVCLGRTSKSVFLEDLEMLVSADLAVFGPSAMREFSARAGVLKSVSALPAGQGVLMRKEQSPSLLVVDRPNTFPPRKRVGSARFALDTHAEHVSP